MNDTKQPGKTNEVKLEWLEPTFEHLNEPQSGSNFEVETDGVGPS